MWLVKLIAYLVLTILTLLVLTFLVAFGVGGLAIAGVLGATAIPLWISGIGIPLGILVDIPAVLAGIISILALLIAATSIILLWVISWRYINKNKKIGYIGSGFMKFASILIPSLGIPIFLEGRGWY